MIQRVKEFLRQKALKDMGVYFAANLIKAALPFIILPFLTLYLVPEEYGLWSLFLALMACFLPLTACGLPTIIARNFHKYDHAEHGKMVFTATVCIALLCFVLFLGLLIASFFTTEIFSIPITWMMVAPLLCFFGNLQYFNKIILVHQNRSLTFAILDVVNIALIRGGGLMAVIFIAATWTSMLAVNIVAQCLFAALALYLLLGDKRFTPAFDLSRARGMIVMGYPIIGHTLGAFVMTLSDRIILEHMTDLETVGIYAIGANLGTGILVFCTAFSQRWGPWQYRQLKDPTKDTKKRIVRYTYLYFLLTAALAVAATLVGYIYVVYLIEESYQQAVAYIPWIAAGAALYGMSLAVTNYVTIEGKTKSLPFVTVTAAVINIILTVWLVQINGAVGAAQATFIAYLYYFIMMWWVNHRVYPMPWRKGLSLQ